MVDPRRLRGLAHPLRMRLRAELMEHGPATASQLAARTGESSGATSYHLRQLAAYGFVVEEPGQGRGRERYWRAVERGALRRTAPLVNGSGSPAPPRPQSLRQTAGTARPTQAEAAGDETWERCEWFLDMTAEESDELSRRFHELCIPYTHGRRERADGTRRVSVQFLIRREPNT